MSSQMLSHSNEPAETNQPQSKKRGRGQPRRIWTKSQERWLIRFVTRGGVQQNKLADAMREEALDGQPAFAPSNQACKDKFIELTNTQPKDARIADPSRMRQQLQKERQAWQAYAHQKSYARRSTGLHSIEEHILGGGNRQQIGENTETSYLSPPALTNDQSSPTESSTFTPIATSIFSPSCEIENDFEDLSARINPKHDTSSQHLQEGSSTMGYRKQHEGSLNCLHKAHVESHSKSTSNARVKSFNSVSSVLLPARDIEGLSSGRPRSILSLLSRRSHRSSDISSMQDGNVQVSDENTSPWYFDWIKNRMTMRRWSARSTLSQTQPISKSVYPPEPSFVCNCTGHVQGLRLLPAGVGCSIEPNLFRALHAAAATNSDVTIQLEKLLATLSPSEAAKHINARSCYGETVLEVALYLGSVSGCRFLVDAGADENALTSDGLDLAHHARRLERQSEDNRYYAAINLCLNAIRSGPHPNHAKAAGRKHPRTSQGPNTSNKKIRQSHTLQSGSSNNLVGSEYEVAPVEHQDEINETQQQAIAGTSSDKLLSLESNSQSIPKMSAMGDILKAAAHEGQSNCVPPNSDTVNSLVGQNLPAEGVLNLVQHYENLEYSRSQHNLTPVQNYPYQHPGPSPAAMRSVNSITQPLPSASLTVQMKEPNMSTERMLSRFSEATFGTKPHAGHWRQFDDGKWAFVPDHLPASLQDDTRLRESSVHAERRHARRETSVVGTRRDPPVTFSSASTLSAGITTPDQVRAQEIPSTAVDGGLGIDFSGLDCFDETLYFISPPTSNTQYTSTVR